MKYHLAVRYLSDMSQTVRRFDDPVATSIMRLTSRRLAIGVTPILSPGNITGDGYGSG